MSKIIIVILHHLNMMPKSRLVIHNSEAVKHPLFRPSWQSIICSINDQVLETYFHSKGQNGNKVKVNTQRKCIKL